jgi:hypothetical protein
MIAFWHNLALMAQMGWQQGMALDSCRQVGWVKSLRFI